LAFNVFNELAIPKGVIKERDSCEKL